MYGRVCVFMRVCACVCYPQAQEYWQLAFLSLLAIAQGTCVWSGLVAGCVVCVSGVSQGTLTVGDAVLFITLMNQLYVPLTYFGSYYRQVRTALRGASLSH